VENLLFPSRKALYGLTSHSGIVEQFHFDLNDFTPFFKLFMHVPKTDRSVPG
jgi:hypothetical protein